MYTGGGYYGDTFSREREESTIRKLQEGYWTAKQVVKAKFGKKEDDYLIASDQEFDAKLAVFCSIKESCEAMLQCIEQYQDFICELSQEENSLGRFLKQRGKEDKTQAGKMMAAVGRAQSFTAQQRLALRVPLVRLYQELDVFSERAVSDCLMTVQAAEKARNEYRGSLLWMKNVSEALDPDAYSRLDKFRKVQGAVKQKKAKFDQVKLDCLQKIDLLAASRCNLFSQLMSNYQKCLMHFWERTSKAHGSVSENFKGYQHYEFTVLKDLSETSRKLAELTAGRSEEKVKKKKPNVDESGAESSKTSALSAEQQQSDENQLISLEGGEGVEEEVTKLNENERRNSIEHLLFDDESPTKDDQNLDSFLASLPSSNAVSEKKKDLIDEGSGRKERNLIEDILNTPSTPQENSFSFQWNANTQKDLSGLSEGSPLHGASSILPSNLINMSSLSGGPASARQQDQKTSATPASSSSDDKAAWLNLFAELDPLANPNPGAGNQGSC